MLDGLDVLDSRRPQHQLQVETDASTKPEQQEEVPR